MKHVLAVLQTVFWVGYAAFFIFSLLVSFTNFQNGKLPFYSFIVQTASMEPTIMTGDVVFIQPAATYKTQDIITFHDAEGHVITHRIVSESTTEPTQFTTKGDNNKTEDPNPVSPDKIIGKHVATVPKAGYVLVNAQKPMSIFLLLAIPAVVLVAGEIFKTKPEKHDQT